MANEVAIRLTRKSTAATRVMNYELIDLSNNSETGVASVGNVIGVNGIDDTFARAIESSKR